MQEGSADDNSFSFVHLAAFYCTLLILEQFFNRHTHKNSACVDRQEHSAVENQGQRCRPVLGFVELV